MAGPTPLGVGRSSSSSSEEVAEAFATKMPSGAHLPDAAIEAMAGHLYGTQLLRLRMVDKRWRSIVTGLVRTLLVSPRAWAGSPRARSEQLAAAFGGSATAVQVVMDANRSPRNWQPALVSEALAPLVTCPSLGTLGLTWRTFIVPNEGYPEDHFDAFVDRWTLSASLLQAALAGPLAALAPRLATLQLNVQSNMLRMLAPLAPELTALTALRYTLSDHYTVCAEDTAVLRSLTLLRSLTVHCWLTPTFSETLLSSLSALTGLEALELDGISIPPDDNRVPGWEA